MRGTRRQAAVILLGLGLLAAGCAGPGAAPGPGESPSLMAGPGTPTPSTTPSQVPPTPAEVLDTAVEELRVATGAPGALGVLVMGDARVAATAGTGDLSGTASLGDDARFRIASITKPIVAALVLTAVDRGEVDLDDVVGDRLPGVLRPDPPVTVRQLLDHTSGVFDEGNEGDPATDIAAIADPELRAEAEAILGRYLAGERVVAPARVLVAMAETHERYFEAGGGYHYSNTNYQVAGMLLEAVTGEPLADLLAVRVVVPLGLGRTTLAPADLTSPELRGYDVPEDGGEPADVTDDLALFGNGGNGGILSTGDDLLAMLRAIVRADLFSPELVTEMTTSNRASYGLGIVAYDAACGTFLGHGGSVNGTQSIALVAPDGSRGIVLAVGIRGPVDPLLETRALDVLCRVAGD